MPTSRSAIQSPSSGFLSRTDSSHIDVGLELDEPVGLRFGDAVADPLELYAEPSLERLG